MMPLPPMVIGAAGVLIFVLLLLLGVPLGLGMATIGFLGIIALKGSKVAFNTLLTIPYSCTASWLLSVIPMFILMGTVAYFAGFAKDAYTAAYKWVGRLPGGLGVGTLIGGAAFGACTGSSSAATAALGKIALPELLRYGYNKKLACGAVSMSGTLAALIPPSILMVVYGVITEQSIGKLLIAGILPGLLSMALFALLVVVWAMFRPQHAPRGESFSWTEKLISLKDFIAILVLFFCVAGGIYSGAFTPTEAGAVGSFVILLMALFMKRLNWPILKEIILDTLKVFSSIYFIILGAYIFIQFLALTRLPVDFAQWVVNLPVDRMIILFATIAVYLILGCFLDAFGMILLTVPFISPAIFALGFDPIWFGVIVVILVEIGLITPPVGIQAYVLKGVAPEGISLKDIFIGFTPFFLVDLFAVIGLLILFPEIATFLTRFMK